MKPIYITIVMSLFFARGYTQTISKADSSVLALKNYIERNTRPSAEMREQNIQGVLILGFKIDSDKKIVDIHFLKPLTLQYDSEAIRVLRSYTKAMFLPPGEYSLAVEFLRVIKGKKETIPVDQSLYPSFLLEADILYM